MNKRILVVAAHPDDEILGVGGTILRHIADNDTVHIVILAEGLTSRDEIRNADIRKKELLLLHKSTYEAADFMGVEQIKLHNFQDNRMDSVTLLDVVKKIETEINEFYPDTVYTHHAGDVNVDHTVAHNAVVTACRSLPGQNVKKILFFETPSSTEWQMATSDKVFLPNYFVNITPFMDKKIDALKYYDSEMREYDSRGGHPRSYEGVRLLGKYRGLTVGTAYAEAFSVGRIIL